MAFAAGQKIRASYFNIPTVGAADAAATDGATTSPFPTYTNSLTTTGILGVAFVAPPSGKVLINYACGEGRTSSATAKFLIDCEVRQGSTVGSGTIVRPSASESSMAGQSDTANMNRGLSGFALVTGLTAGSSYNACLTYSVTGGTGTFNRRKINVTLLLA